MELLNKEQVTAALQKGTQTVIKHSPKILTAAGIAGFFTTVIFAVKSKGKADLLVNEALEQKKADVQEKIDKGEEVDVKVEDVKLTPFEKVKAVTPAYWPTAAMFILSSAAVIGSDVISDKRQVALTAMYSIADTSLKEYQKKTLEKLGPKKEDEIRGAAVGEELKRQPISIKTNEYISHHSEYSLFMAPITKQLFFAKIDDVKQVMNSFKERIYKDYEISLNEILWELSTVAISRQEGGIGIEENAIIGDMFRWTCNHGDFEWKFVSTPLPGKDGVNVNYIDIPKYETSSY
jgi:hypothetical protein